MPTIFLEECIYLVCRQDCFSTLFLFFQRVWWPILHQESNFVWLVFQHHLSTLSGISFWPHTAPQVNEVLLFQSRPSWILCNRHHILVLFAHGLSATSRWKPDASKLQHPSPRAGDAGDSSSAPHLWSPIAFCPQNLPSPSPFSPAPRGNLRGG